MHGCWLFGHMAGVYVAVAAFYGHRPYLLFFLRVFSRWHALIPSILSAVLAASSCIVSSSQPWSPCCGLVPCRVWAGRGWLFSCVCGRGVGGVSRIPSLPCFIPSALWSPAPFLLVHARAVLSLAAALFLFSILGGVWHPPCFCARAFFCRFFLPSSPFIPFCLFAASLVCMCSVALHTLLCLRRLVCVCMAWAYLSLPMHVGRECSLGYTSLATIHLSAVLAALSGISLTPPWSRRDVLWACVL